MTPTPRSRFALTPMRPRDPAEPHRAATPLELFFDLVFVVAVSIAASNLHHALAEGHAAAGLQAYLLVFFGIWWAWMNFTWFATAFSNEDWLYRLLTFVQMAGVLVFAAGIEPAFASHDYAVLVAGYVVMRVAMVAQWLRAARGAPELRRTALTYAVGIAVLQVVWVAYLWVPSQAAGTALLVSLVLGEVAVPVAAERRRPTPWHAHHITERYGLFTIIVLGESLLASANAVIEAIHGGEEVRSLAELSALTLLVAAALWWIYFWPPHHRSIGSLWRSVRYGYGHYLVFASAAAVSAAVELEIDVISGHAEVSRTTAGLALSVPIAVFVFTTWWIAIRDQAPVAVNVALPLAAVLVLLDPLVPVPFAVTGAVLVGVVVVLVLNPPRARGHAASVAP